MAVLPALPRDLDGLVQIPKVDSLVLVAKINNQIENRFVVAFSEVEEVLFFNGENGGLVKVADLKTKLNNLENKVNELITTLKGIVIPLAPSGTYPFAPVFASTTSLTPTEEADIKNDKVKH